MTSSPATHPWSRWLKLRISIERRPRARQPHARIHKGLRPLLLIEQFIELHILSWDVVHAGAARMKRVTSLGLCSLHQVHGHGTKELCLTFVASQMARRHTVRCEHGGIRFHINTRSGTNHRWGFKPAVESLRVLVFECGHWRIRIGQRIGGREHHGRDVREWNVKTQGICERVRQWRGRE